MPKAAIKAKATGEKDFIMGKCGVKGWRWRSCQIENKIFSGEWEKNELEIKQSLYKGLRNKLCIKQNKPATPDWELSLHSGQNSASSPIITERSAMWITQEYAISLVH